VRRRLVAGALVVAGLGCGLAAAAQPASFLTEEARFTGFEVSVPMRDGKALAGDVYVPKASPGPLPVILIQTPYDKKRMRAAFADPDGSPSGPLFADTHYIYVITDWRGRAASADAMAPGAVPGGTEDGFDTLEWVASQPWCNGRIGTWGVSALARVQYMTMRSPNPHHLCAVPGMMPLNLTYEIYFPGGALWQEFVDTLGRIGFDAARLIKSNPVKNAMWRAAEKTFVEPAELTIPMLIYGGWYDVYTDAVIETYRRIRAEGGPEARAQSRLVMGPWEHGGSEPVEQGELEFESAAHYANTQADLFFDACLRDQGSVLTEGEDPVTYFQMGAGEWRHAKDWPPAGYLPTPFYLGQEGGLSPAGSTDAAAPLVFVYDPADPVPTVGGHILDQSIGRGPRDQHPRVETRDDVLVFSTPVLERDLDVAGRPLLELEVSTDRPDTDFTAILTDVYPDGRSILIGEGIQRLRFRDGFEAESPAAPGEVYRITIPLQNTAITFLAGHRVRVLVSSSNDPHYARNLNDGGPMYGGGEGQKARNTVYVGGENSSRLLLPVRGDGPDG